MRRILVLVCVLLVIIYTVPSFSQEPTKVEFDDMIPKEKIEEFQHLLVMGINQPFSKGFNEISPLFLYTWFGDNFQNKDFYMQFTLQTTRIYLIAAMKTDRIFAGIKPMVEHSTFASFRSYNRGYNDRFRQFGGNNAGIGAFFQYNWLRILSTKLNFHTSYHFYRLILLTENENKYPNMPKRHWQVKPGIEILLSDVKETSLTRVKHGYLVRGEYQYARRVGYGTWYDYDRLWFREKVDGKWLPPTMAINQWTEGVWYKSTVRDTHRLYFNLGAYYNFKHDINLHFDFNGGFFKGVDRNNAEHIGYMQADYAVMPGYADTEFYHNFYLISRLQIGFPIPFWDARIQPGFNVLYMPKTNDVVGQGRGMYVMGQGALMSYRMLALNGYPKRFYTSVSCSFSLKLGDLLPLFIDYAYGIDAVRAKSAYKLYTNRLNRGCHELNVLVVMAFGSNAEKKEDIR